MVFIEFAPLNIPFERRLQTLAVVHFVFFFLVAPPLSIFIAIYLLFTSFWWISISYAVWFIYDYRTPEHGSRPSKWFQDLKIWKYFAQYFPMELIKTSELSPENNYIIGSHPHGVMSIGAYTTFCTNGTGFWEKFPGINSYLGTLNGQFWFPFRREYILISGVISCGKESLKHMLSSRKGQAIGIVLGGAEEALDAHHDNYDLLLLRRRGFAKMALETGAHLVPMFNFGENDTYNQASNVKGTRLRNFQESFRRIVGFSPVFLSGRGIFNYTYGILPFRRPIHTVVGRPIPVKQTSNPTSEEIDNLHDQYCDELTKLFDEYKTKYGVDPNQKLHFY